MYLMDSLIEVSHKAKQRNFVWVNGKKELEHPLLTIYPSMEEKLKGCPRFLFNEDAIQTAVELTLGRPKVLREAMQHLTIPYPKMWIEWPESGREKLRKTFTYDSYEHPGRPLPKRLGFMLETENGRKGTATWVWDNFDAGKDVVPNICPISPYFDLDFNYGKLSNSRTSSFLDANLMRIWKDNKIQTEALLSIWDTSVHKPSEWGARFLQAPVIGFRSYDDRMAHFYADVYGEYIMIWSCLMLLTSSRKIVDLEQVDMKEYNKIRRRMNKLPKLDHTVVTIHISAETKMHQQGMPLGYTRKSPRIHMVGSYLNRRGNKHWVVQPFWRGSGETISRHVHVKP